MGQLGEVRFGVARIELFERVPHPAVQLHASSGCKLVVESVADKHVREAHPTGLGRHVGHHALARSFVEDLEQLITTHVAYSLERGEIELAPEHRGENEDEAAVLGQVSQPPLDHCAHPFRNHPAPGFGTRDRFERLFSREQPDQLPGKERVAVGGPMEGAPTGTSWR